MPAVSALINACGDRPFPHVACVDHYGSALPGGFSRGVLDTYTAISADDSSISSLKDANFIIFDQKRGLEILGSSPVVEDMFDIDYAAPEAPVYVPETNELWIGGLQTGVTHQIVVKLSENPPKPENRFLDPPIYAANGMRYRDGRVWVAGAGANDTLEGGPYHTGIYSFDPKTGKSRVESNNYYGLFLNGPNDLALDPSGRVWFTDPLYSRNLGVNTRAPGLPAAIYRYDPESGETKIVDDTLEFPNGIAFSPDGRTLYATNTAAGAGNTDPATPWQSAGPLGFVQTGKRILYAFDVVGGGEGPDDDNNNGAQLRNRRPLWSVMDYVADCVKAAPNGLVVTAAGHGVDVLDPATGSLLLRVQLSFLAVSFEFVGDDDLWIIGHGKAARVRGLNFKGPAYGPPMGGKVKVRRHRHP